MSFVRLLAPCLVLLGFLATAAEADSAPEVVACPTNQGSLALLSCTLAQKLGGPARGARVVVVDLKTDRELPNPDALRERLRAVVTTALGGRPGASNKLRVELRVEKSGGVLRVTAELRRALGLWQRLRHEQPRAEAHAFVELPLDAELRALIPPPPLVVSETLKLKAPERGIMALGCGPLGSDGGQELALVSRGSVRVGHIRGNRFLERKRAAWSALSPVAPAPLREPLGTVDITPEGSLRVGSSDRRDGLTLSGELLVTQRFANLLPLPGGRCAARSGLGVVARAGACAGAPSALLDSVAGAAQGWVGRDWATHLLTAERLEILPPSLQVGAQLALGDADGDGALELLYSADTLEPANDRVTLVTLTGNGPRRHFELAVPGVSAVAICQRQEGPGMAPLVIATNEELWLLR